MQMVSPRKGLLSATLAGFQRCQHGARSVNSRINRMNSMNTYLITRPAAWANAAELEATAKVSARIGDEQMPDRVRWIRSYVTQHENGRIGTVCVYQATDPEALREHARCVGMPAETITPVADTVVIREDPVAAGK
jgi:hypothetical protein